MTNVSISELKAKPAQFIKQSLDYPVAVENRNEITAYLIGKDLFERIVTYLEDYLDKKVIERKPILIKEKIFPEWPVSSAYENFNFSFSGKTTTKITI